MINYKNEIAKYIQDTLDTKINELESFIEIPPNNEMGDYSFPCFKLAKELRKGETARYYTKDGKFYMTGSCDLDLFFATEKHEGWINIYHNSEGAHYVMVCPIFESKEEAEKTGKRYINYMATIKIEWEE